MVKGIMILGKNGEVKKDNSRFGYAITCLSNSISAMKVYLPLFKEKLIEPENEETEKNIEIAEEILEKVEDAISFLENGQDCHARLLELEEENIKLRDRVKELEDAAGNDSHSS